VDSVTEIIVFGSYLDPTVEVLGDLDLAFSLTRRVEGEDFPRADQIVKRRAYAAGFRHGGTIVEQVCCSQLWFRRQLRGGRVPYLRSVQLDDEVRRWLADKPHKVVFTALVSRFDWGQERA